MEDGETSSGDGNSIWLELMPAGLRNRFEAQEVLGRGAQGVVIRARDRASSQLVVVKVLVSTTPADGERFLRESRFLTAMDHPNLVRVLETGVEDRHPYFVQPYEKGRSLVVVLREKGPLPWREAAHLLEQVARALDHIHRKGIVHRDVKPGNILRLEETAPGGIPHFRLIDFGLSHHLGDDRLTEPGYLVGSIQYTAPERFLGTDLDARSDLYSLGVTAYELLTGANPFRGNSVDEVQQNHMTTVIRRVPAPVPIPRSLSELLLDLLKKAPAERPRSARVVADRAQEAQGTLGIRLPEGPTRALGVSGEVPTPPLRPPVEPPVGRRKQSLVQAALATGLLVVSSLGVRALGPGTGLTWEAMAGAEIALRVAPVPGEGADVLVVDLDGGEAAHYRTGAEGTLRLGRLPGGHRYQVTVHDGSGQITVGPEVFRTPPGPSGSHISPGAPPLGDLLARARAAGDPAARHAAWRALADPGRPGTGDILIRELKAGAREPDLLWSLVLAGERAAAPLVADLLRGTVREARLEATAVMVLALLEERSYLPELRSRLTHRDPGVVRAAIWAAGWLRDEDSAAVLESLAAAPSPYGPVAAWALARIAGRYPGGNGPELFGFVGYMPLRSGIWPGAALRIAAAGARRDLVVVIGSETFKLPASPGGARPGSGSIVVRAPAGTDRSMTMFIGWDGEPDAGAEMEVTTVTPGEAP